MARSMRSARTSSKSGEATTLKGCEGFPLKLVAPEVDYNDQQLILETGDKILIYTDGVNENMNDRLEQFGIDRIIDCLNRYRGYSATDLIEKLANELDLFSDGYPQADDITMLVLEFC